MSLVALGFLAVAALTFAGFGAGRVFQRTRFPDAPILLGLGLLAGPVNALLVAHGTGIQVLADALAPERLHSVAPAVSALALVVILFDAGLELRLRALRRSLAPALLHTTAIFVLTVAGCAALGHLVFGMPWLVGCVLGVVLASVDQTVSAGMLQQLRVSEQVRAVSVVEMALYDIACIPILVCLLTFGEGGGHWTQLGPVAKSLASIMALSMAVGTATGISWAYALRGLRGHPNSYMLTFAMVLATYGLGELSGGSGPLAILLFGLIVGNRREVMRGLSGARDTTSEDAKVQSFHDEITFFVRTLFFLYLGAGFEPQAAGGGLVLAGAVLATAAISLARWVGLRATTLRSLKPDRALAPVFGRGLDTAVLAGFPFVWPAFVPGTPFHDLFAPYQGLFGNLGVLVILFTVIVSSLWLFFQERSPTKAKLDLAARHGVKPPAPPLAPRGPERAIPTAGLAERAGKRAAPAASKARR